MLPKASGYAGAPAAVRMSSTSRSRLWRAGACRDPPRLPEPGSEAVAFCRSVGVRTIGPGGSEYFECRRCCHARCVITPPAGGSPGSVRGARRLTSRTGVGPGGRWGGSDLCMPFVCARWAPPAIGVRAQQGDHLFGGPARASAGKTGLVDRALSRSTAQPPGHCCAVRPSQLCRQAVPVSCHRRASEAPGGGAARGSAARVSGLALADDDG